MDLEKYVIQINASIKEALFKIENNQKGFIFISDVNGKIVGIATDGDIRRNLIKGNTIYDSISNCANFNYIKA